MIFKHFMGYQRDDDCLQTVGDQGYEHRQGIEYQVAQEGSDASRNEGFKRIEKQARDADHGVAKIEVSARDRDPEGRQGDVHSHEQGCESDPNR